MKPLERIMMVDDEPDIRTIGVLALETVGGMTVMVCESGTHALQSFPSFQPDLILLDVMMPGMDGRTVLEQLRKEPGGADIPVIFFTAKTQPDEISALKRLGAIAVMNKPFDPMTLAGDVRKAWEEAHANVPVAEPAAADPVAARMEELKATFRERAIASMKDLHNAVQQLDTGTSPEQAKEVLKEIRGIAHKLAGRGGTFGFPEVSEVSGRLEVAVYDVLDAEDPRDKASQEQMRTLVDRLSNVIDTQVAA